MPFGFVELTIADAREQSNAKVFVQLSQVLTIRRINDTTHLEFAAGTGETETRTVAAQLQPPRLSRPPRLAVVETPDEIWAAVQRTR